MDGEMVKEKTAQEILEKSKKIRAETAKLKKLFKDIADDKKILADRLINKAAFLKVSLDELEDTINKDGYMSTYKNGENQWGTKKNPEVEIYTAWIKNYQSIIESLVKILPEKPTTDVAGEIMDFCAQGIKRAGR